MACSQVQAPSWMGCERVRVRTPRPGARACGPNARARGLRGGFLSSILCGGRACPRQVTARAWERGGRKLQDTGRVPVVAGRRGEARRSRRSGRIRRPAPTPDPALTLSSQPGMDGWGGRRRLHPPLRPSSAVPATAHTGRMSARLGRVSTGLAPHTHIPSLIILSTSSILFAARRGARPLRPAARARHPPSARQRGRHSRHLVRHPRLRPARRV